MRATNRLVSCVVALAATVTLASCSLIGTQDPIVEGTSDPTPSPSSTSSPPPLPELPDTATEKTVDGGVEFVEYYYNLVEYGHETGKWGPLRKLTDEACIECQKFWSVPELFDRKEDVRTEIGSPHSGGIDRNQMAVNAIIDVGVGVADAGSEVELYERTSKTWQDDVTISYASGWTVTKIEPDQLLPRDSCIADRCRDYQKKRAEEGR